MKKVYLTTFLIVGILFNAQVFGQKQALITNSSNDNLVPTENAKSKASLYYESFYYSSFSASGWTVNDAGAKGWILNNTNKAGGQAPELVFLWGTEAGGATINGTTKCVSPKINTVGQSKLLFFAKLNIDDYEGGANEDEVRIETTSDGTTWNEIYKFPTTDENYMEEINVIIENSDVGSENFQIALVFKGNSYNIDFIYWDDIELTEDYATDMTPVMTNISEFIQMNTPFVPEVTVKNKGLSTSDVDVTLTINEGTTVIYSETVTASVNSFEKSNVQFPELSLDKESSFDYKVSVSAANDGNTDNNTLENSFETLSIVRPKIPLIEVFTSATCGPCASANPVLKAFLDKVDESEYSLVKYQMNWPGSGDIYYTNQGGERRGFFAVSSVPAFYVNAQNVGVGDVEGGWDIYSSLSSSIDIQIEAEITSDNTLEVSTIIESGKEISNANLFVIAVEKETTGNVGSNGEKSFEHVMHYMLTGGSGETINLAKDTPLSGTYSRNMSSTNMEEAHDLQIVVFIQDLTSRNIYQSASKDVKLVYPVKPLIEQFTSSTCSNCADYNPILKGVLDGYPNKYSLVKYPVNWPGEGDSYFNTSSANRIDYYSVSSTPSLYTNGNSGLINTNSEFSKNLDNYGTIDLKINTVNIDNNTVDIAIQLVASETIEAGKKLHVAVVEKVTTGNVGSNGEEEFYHTMLDMKNDGLGIELEKLEAISVNNFNVSFDLSQTNMEDYHNIAVIAFVQDDQTKEVLQSDSKHDITITNAEDNFIKNISIYPSPSNGNVCLIGINDANIVVYNVTGQIVASFDNVIENQKLDLNYIENGTYILRITENNKSGVLKMVIQK